LLLLSLAHDQAEHIPSINVSSINVRLDRSTSGVALRYGRR
jgi:hypothetical protein